MAKTPKILIISSEEDGNFKEITEWLRYYKANFFCINIATDIVSIEDYNMQTETMSLSVENSTKKQIVHLKQVKTVFIRNGELKLKLNPIPKQLSAQMGVKQYFYSYIQTQNNFLEYFLQSKCNVIGLWGAATINKLIVLKEAKKIGFKIPDTYLKTALNLLKTEETYISKTLGLPFIVESEGRKFYTYTSKIKKSDTKKQFMTSLVQKEVKKLFEIRVFVLLDNVFSMAIFSQMNKESVVDYRVYNNKNPYLKEPFQLPKHLKKKLFLLMKALKINTGSFDFMYTTEGEYCFLEVNPIGQFGSLGAVCGIDLNKVIAKEIINL